MTRSLGINKFPKLNCQILKTKQIFSGKQLEQKQVCFVLSIVLKHS